MLAKESSEVAITYMTNFYIMPYEDIISDMKFYEDNNIKVQFTFGDKKDFLQTDFEKTGTLLSQRLSEMGYDATRIKDEGHALHIYSAEFLVEKLKNLSQVELKTGPE